MDTRFGELPGLTLIDRVSNVYANALMNSQKCSQLTVALQNITVNCSPEKAVEMASSKECHQAILSGIDSDKYCKACFIADANQNILIDFTGQCGFDSINKAATDTLKWLDEYAVTLGATPRQQYVEMRNQIKTGLNDYSILQSLIAAQDMTVTGEQKKTFINQSGVYNAVATALLNRLPSGLNNLESRQIYEPRVVISESTSMSSVKSESPPVQKNNNLFIIYVLWVIIIVSIVAVTILTIVKNR